MGCYVVVKGLLVPLWGVDAPPTPDVGPGHFYFRFAHILNRNYTWLFRILVGAAEVDNDILAE